MGCTEECSNKIGDINIFSKTPESRVLCHLTIDHLRTHSGPYRLPSLSKQISRYMSGPACGSADVLFCFQKPSVAIDENKRLSSLFPKCGLVPGVL